MSPGWTATREQAGARTAPSPSAPPLDVLLGLANEVVVDWQLPPDLDKKN
jgi:hypothetical protein